ncbi:MAG: L-threonine 3-dehydrogenase [Chloroflexota bacterium]|nr:L-threonine 3-dehydrogenase [Chloroflexota bacterium]MDE3193004.1 L-threonine 3-dehydrogenase [Chloroflexota bacterium]
MRAIVKTGPAPGLALEDVDRPTIGPNDLLVRVRYTSICGTDLHIWNWDHWAQQTIHPPLIVGHEFEGEIAEVGSEVSGFAAGARVAVEGHVTCGHCRNCRAGRRHLCRNAVGIGVQRAGAFADYVAVPAVNAYVMPPGMPDEIGSCLDPLGNAVHSALSFDLVGEDVLITGAGPIGVMAAAVSRFVGARYVVVTDVNHYRLALARRMGATIAVDPTTTTLRDVMRELGMQEGYDVGLEMSGNPDALRSMLEAMNHGGRIALLGIPDREIALDLTTVIFRGLVVKGIYGREMFETWYRMGVMLQSGLDITPVITHRFPAERFAEAFEVVRSGQCGKVVLDWTS